MAVVKAIKEIYTNWKCSRKMEKAAAAAKKSLQRRQPFSIFTIHAISLKKHSRHLGLEIGTIRDCRKQVLQDDSSSNAEQDSSSSQTTDQENGTKTEDTASDNQKNSQEDLTTPEEDVDPPSTALDQQLTGTNRRGPKRSGLGSGQGPQVN